MARSIAASGDDAGSGPASAATNPRREAANAPRAARSAGRAAGDNICERRRRSERRVVMRRLRSAWERPSRSGRGADSDLAAELGPERDDDTGRVHSRISVPTGVRGRVVHRSRAGAARGGASRARRRRLPGWERPAAARARRGEGSFVRGRRREDGPPSSSSCFSSSSFRRRRGTRSARVPRGGSPRRRRGREARGTVQTPRGVPGLVPGLWRPPRGRVPPSVREPRDRARRFRATRGAPAPRGRPRGRVRPVRPPLRLLQRAAHRARFRGLRRGLPHERDGGGDAGVVRSAHRRRRLARVLGRVRERGRDVWNGTRGGAALVPTRAEMADALCAAQHAGGAVVRAFALSFGDSLDVDAVDGSDAAEDGGSSSDGAPRCAWRRPTDRTRGSTRRTARRTTSRSTPVWSSATR